MPTATRDGIDLYYETDGDGETVAFVGDLGYGAWQWGWQAPAVAGPFETLVWDLPGTGRSDAPPGPYAVADLSRDLDAVLRDAGAGRPHLVGAGLGGMVALSYALERGVRSLTLIGTAATGMELPAEPREAMFAPPDDHEALVESLDPVLSADFRGEFPEVVDGIAEWRAADDADREGWEAQAAAMANFDVRDELYEVTDPALVVHGESDRVVPVGFGEDLAVGLPSGEIETFPEAGHLVGVERSRPVNDRLRGFLEDQTDLEFE